MPQQKRKAWKKLGPGLALLLALGGFATSARADYESARGHFESLSTDDKIEIMLGLVGTGDFTGLIEFGFTKRFYKSVLAFEMRRGLRADGILDGRELQVLKQDTAPFYGNIGTEWVDHPFAGSRLLVPLALFDEQTKTENGIAYERRDENLSLSFLGYPDSEKSFGALYEKLSSESNRRTVLYKRLKTDYFVVNGTYRGRSFYTWISRVPGGSTGFTLAWSSSWDAMGSKLSILLANAFIPVKGSAAPEAEREPEVSASQPAPEPEPPPESSTGTGFKVTAEGHVLTNFHVAGRCREITLRRPGDLPVEAELVAGDEMNDLALVRARTPLGAATADFRGGPQPRAGTEIVVFGFPLSGIPAPGGNIVTGNITSLAGMANNSGEYQISAPVQPGNSGGPVLDREGRVVAVVVSKLDALKTAARSGDIPQNVNFAIKSSVATNFLDGAAVTYQTRQDGSPLETPELAERAQGFTYLVACRN